MAGESLKTPGWPLRRDVVTSSLSQRMNSQKETKHQLKKKAAALRREGNEQRGGKPDGRPRSHNVSSHTGPLFFSSLGVLMVVVVMVF